MKTRLLAFFAFVCLAFPALAGGSFDLEDIRPLLKGSAEWEKIEKTFDVEAIGDAVRLGRQFENLGGARCGPYQLGASLKGSRSAVTHQITIETNTTFLRKGKKITENLEKNADDFTEELVSIKVTRLPAPGGKKEPAPATVAKTAEGAVREYFALVNARKPKAAYECFSAEFKQKKTLQAYTSAFGDTTAVELQAAREEKTGSKRFPTVNVRLIVWDGKNKSTTWAGPIGLRPEGDGWKIDDMGHLVQE